MTGSQKRRTLILLGLVVIMSMLIAASLSQLELKPGQPLPRLENSQVVTTQGETRPAMSISVNKFFLIVFGLACVGLAVYMLINLLRGLGRKELVAMIQPFLLVVLMLGSMIIVILLMPRTQSAVVAELPMPTPEPPVTSPLGAVPPLLLWLVGIGLLVLSLLAGAWIFLSGRRQERPIDLVGLEAEKAWQALKTGLDLKDVIISCYRQMSLALEQEQGLERKDFMTTGEFENLLQAAGVPHDPIHQLTRLFDAVRYGDWQPNPSDEQKAIESLEAIIAYSHAARSEH
jgi:hypothetical protein